MNIKVRFKDRELWWLKDADGSGALAPLEHCDDDGHVEDFETALFADSYAHVFRDGKIKRYGETIGTVEELELL